MKTYTGFEYLCIDAANQFGLDKDLFEDRIKWVWDHMHELEALADQADNPPLYKKAVMAIRKAQQRIPTGHLVAFDAVCSGIQVMSAMTGCITGATNTGLVDPNVRADAYTTLTKTMNEELGGTLNVPRKDNKQALMTVMYGSKEEPKKIFGEDTPELSAFYKSAQAIAPGAWELLNDLLKSWRPFALVHEWKLPDGFDVRVKVMVKKECRIEVDELDHATFTYEYYENEGTKKGLSNVANVVHSVDAYVLRCMHRRCNYDAATVYAAEAGIAHELARRVRDNSSHIALDGGGKVDYYVEQYKRSGMADIVILPYLVSSNQYPLIETEHLQALHEIVKSMLRHKPFELVTIHDSFAAHANNINHLRQHYIDIFAELAESNILSDILSQLYGIKGQFPKLSDNLGQLIRGSNYALS